jgi:uncharacterized repeat protein (TIGR02543 family)
MKKHFLVSFLTIFLLTFISVAYASFSSVLTITGEATVVKDTTAPTCGSWYLRDSSLTTQEAYDQNKFINAGTNTTWSNTDKTLFIECTDNMDDEYGCVNVDTVTTSGSGKRYFKDVKEYTTSIKSDSNTVTVTLKDAYMNERTCTLPVGGSNPYIDKEEPTITITRSAANKFTYSATDNMSSSVTPRFMVTTSSTKPALDDANWSSSASEVTIDNSAAKTYYVWAKDGVNITNSTISTYLLTKSQGTGTTLTLKYQNNSGATLSTGYVLNGTPVYAEATPSTGYNTALIKKDSTTAATGTGTNSVNTTITVNAATTISSSATANTYSIGYTMNGGPNPSTKPTSGTYNANVNISNPGSKSVTITPNANNSGATVGSAVVATQTFAGWTSTTMQGNAQSGSTTSNYAAWTGTSTKNTYFKNLRNDTGTVTMVANWNTSASTLPTLTAPSGYTCKWYDTQGTSGGTELGGSGDPYTPSATSGSTVNVYARCTANTYYVYYNQGLATGGWNATTYATQSRTYPNSTTLRTNSMTKSNTTANSYTVTYNQGTATDGWNATTYATQTSTNTTTYTANGWTTGSTNLNDPDYANGASFGSNSTTNLTLYPNFTSSTTNGGVTTKTNNMTKSNSADSDSYTLTFKQGTATSAAPSAITNKKYTSYTANGWTTTSGSTSRTYANNTATGALSSNITLYPCFSQTVNQKSITLPAAATKSNTNLGTVTFNYNGSGAAATTSTAYTTYAFNGWYTASTGGTKLGNASATYTPSASIDVYPQFTGTAHSATFPSNPTRTGYTFAGWYTAASGGTEVTSYTGSSAVEYYAHWTENTYSLTFDGVYNTFQAKVLSASGTVKQTVDITSTSKTISNIAYTDIITTTTVGVSKAINGTTFTKVAASNNPTRTGYSLGNYTMGAENTSAYRYDGSTWYTDYNGSSGCKTFSRMASTQGYNAKLTLTWTPNVYTIVLNNQSATSAGTTQVWYKYNTVENNCYYYSNSDLSTCLTNGYDISVPTKTGYTFNGYYTSTSGGGTQYVNSSGSFVNNIYTKVPSQINSSYTDTITLYAYWTANTYYVYYNQGLATGGWDATTYSTQSRTYPNSTTLRTNSMTKSNTTANSYTVTYNQGTADGGWNATTYAAQTSTNTTTYTANGWTTGSTNLNDPDYANGATYGANSTSNVTLYPNFTTSTTNGGVTTKTNSMTKSNSADSDSYTLTFKQGTATSAAPSAITNKKYTSYTANGWTTTSGSTSRTYANNTATGALSANVNLYPCFSQTVNQKSITLPSAATKSNTNLGTVTFNYNGSGAAATTSTGYTTYAFNGWYTASSGGTKLGNASATYTPSASIDVYPQFTSTAHSATFPSPTRTGYTFAGWWTAASGGTQVTSYTGSSNVEYYAHWTPITYTVVYNKSNSNETGTLPSNQSGTYDVALTLGTNSMSRPNSSDTDSYTLTFKQGTATSAAPSAITNKKYTSYTANGWAISANAGRSYTSGQSVSNLTSTNNGTYNLYTSWSSTVNQRSITLPAAATKSNTDLGTVTFNYNGSGATSTTSTGYTTYAFSGWYTASSGGTKLGNASATYTPSASIDVYPQFTSTAHSATFPSSPTRTGYIFAGWYTAASGGTQVTSYTGSSNVEYYAHWTANTYTIAYTMNNGTDPNPKPTSGTYDSNVSIGTTSIPTKTVTITGNANGTGASVGAATVNSLTFNGWSTSSGAGLQGNAQSGSTTSNLASWSGGATTNKYFKNLRNGSGTVTLTANWSTTVTLPTLSKTGHTCSWVDSNGNPFSTTIAQNASTSITVYAQCTPNTYNITLNQQSGSGGTSTIYEKYSDGYYLNNSGGVVSNKMSTSANGVTVPTRSGYTFGGYYTSTNGGGTQYIDANGKLTSSASPTQFSAAGNLYAKWTLNTPATPTISGGATKIYGSSATTLTCSNSTTYPSGITKKYQFGYATSDGGTPSNWTTESDANTLVIAANAYVEQRWYSCRVRAYDGSAYSGYATSSTSADTEMTINNATLTFDANYGTGGGTVYTRTGQSVVYNGIRSTTTTSIPTASRPGYDFMGWYDSASGGNKVLNADGSFAGTVSGYTSNNTWVATTNKTLYAYWNGISYMLTFHYENTQKHDIPYTSSNTYQTITIPVTGKYRLEAWGAQGGSSVNDGGSSHSAGGKGAYTAGTASFNQNETLYAYVGQQPGYVSSGKADNPGGWNGGGNGRWDHGDNDSSGGGGGATDFRYFGSDTPNLTYNNAVSLRYRIMVAGGGSGSAWSSAPGPGGALESSLRGRVTSRTNQTTGASFGTGGTSGVTGKTKVGNSGGGGGYWGGYAGGARSGNTDDSGQGTGGSSYISGYTGSVAVISNAANTPRYASDGTTLCANGTTDNTCSIHFTGKVFEDPVMISGDSAPTEVVGTDEELEYIMEEPDGIEVYGHAGHGHAKISLESTTKQVTSGQAIGAAPLPYGDTFTDIVEEEGVDDNDIPYYYSYDVLYDIHWAYKDSDDEDIPIDLGDPYDPSYGTDLYAYGIPHEYSITYNGVSYEETNDLFPYDANHPTHYNSLDEFTIDNPVDHYVTSNNEYYIFEGWTGTDLVLNTFNLDIQKGDSGNKEFTANWTQKTTFSITYNANGGTTTCPNQTGSYGDRVWICLDEPTYGDVEFLGWYTKPSGGKLVSPYDGKWYAFGNGNENYGDWVLYAHWDIDAIEFNYNINRSFAGHRMIDTYYTVDWSKTIEFETKVQVSTASKRYLLFGNYDNSSANALNLEIAQNNTIRVYVGKGSTNATFGSISVNKEITIKALWNGTTKKLTVDVSGGGTGHYEATLSALTGTANRRMRIGAADYRASTSPFNTINVKSFIIREFYDETLQENVTVPDPAGHYLLFDGWTGANGDTPQYGLTVPIGSEGLISYTANWSTGVSFQGYSKTFSTSNKYIKFKNEVTVVYIDQARRYAYTRERVYFYRTNTGYNTYGQGSMTVRYNWSASYIDRTVDLAGKKINENGITLWSENWNAYSVGYRAIPYLDNGTRSVTLGVKNFTHAIFSVSTPKNATFALPAIRVKPTE